MCFQYCWCLRRSSTDSQKPAGTSGESSRDVEVAAHRCDITQSTSTPHSRCSQCIANSPHGGRKVRLTIGYLFNMKS